MEYWSARISASQATHIVHTFNKAVSSVLEQQNSTIQDLNLFSEEDKRIVMAWNENLPETSNTCVHDLVHQRMLTQPEAPAICAWDGEFTYRQLDNLSSRLAFYMINMGACSGTVVALCFDKSAYIIIAILAVMKTGAAYIAIDPKYPMARKKYILDTTEASILISAPHHTELFQGLLESIVQLDASFLNSLSASTSSLPVISPGNVALIVFTSGSTGKPKGVPLLHQSISTMARMHGIHTGYSSKMRVLQFAAYSWDVSHSDIAATLIHGGCVCVPSEHDRLNNLSSAINKMRVNWIELTPTVAEMLDPQSVPTLETLTLGGEQITPGLHSRWCNRVRLLNSYGPSEATITSCVGPLGPLSKPFCIGRAHASRVWITTISNYNRLAPIGAVGELLIEGPTLSPGYLKDPEKTQATFVRNPSWLTGSGSRLYRTGDLARYNFDGTIDYIGRIDTQVKIHGQRIELSEIEYHVKNIFDKAEWLAVEVVNRPSSSARKTLAVFFTHATIKKGVDSTPGEETEENGMCAPLSEDDRAELQELQAALAESLPAHMVPSLFVALRYMPLSASGKLDRKTIRQASSELSQTELASYSLAGVTKQAPSTDMGRRLQSIWASVLGISPGLIGAEDSFFRLGGDSLGAMHLVHAAQAQDLSITVNDIFRYPRLLDMVERVAVPSKTEDVELKPFSMISNSLDGLLENAAKQCNVGISAIEDAYPCTPLQEGLLALTNRRQGAYLSQTVFPLPSGLNLQRFKTAWQQVADIHPILRTRVVQPASSSLIQVVIREEIRWRGSEDLAEYLTTDKAMEIKHGDPLVRFAIVGAASEPCHFVWTAHHASYDGWSVGVLFKQVEDLYRNNSLESKPVAFNKFIQYVIDRDNDSAEKFWVSQFPEELPATYPPLPAPTYEAAPNRFISHPVSLPSFSSSDFTISTILRAAWAMVLATYSSSDNIVFGMPLSGRNAPVPGITEISGPTLTTVPISVRLDRCQSLSAFLGQIRDQAVEMIPFEHTGLQNIRYLVEEKREGIKDVLDSCNLLVIQPKTEATGNFEMFGETATAVDDSGFNTYPLVMTCILDDDSMSIEAQFDDRILPVKQARRVMAQFEHTTKQLLIASDATKIKDIHMITPEDERQIAQWNLEVPRATESSLNELISERMTAQPDALAICAWDGSLSYGELDRLSTGLANHLKNTRNIGPETIVAVAFEKSLWAVVSMLAVIKAGAACGCIDPLQPMDRLNAILEDANIQVILTSSQYAHRFEQTSKEAFVIDSKLLQTHVTSNEMSKPLPRVDPRSAVFLIFTSGSTGRPKGIVLEHRSLCTSAKAVIHSVQNRRPTDRVLQFASFTFDMSTSDIFFTLICGGCICIPSDHDRLNNLAKSIRDMNANWMHITPTVANMLEPSDMPNLKTLVVEGEAVPKSLVQKWAPFVELVIGYGNSECSITTAGRGSVTAGSNPLDFGSPIGGNRAHCRFWICESLNDDRLAPIGAVGELLIEGPTLARYYLKDAVKTAESFIVGPPWSTGDTGGSPRRFYKTGDLVKYNPDGSFRYIARKDMQVKLRGQRIELGEIEYHARNQCSNTYQVVADVVSKGDTIGEKALAIFIVLASPEGQETDASDPVITLPLTDQQQTEFLELQAYLATKLPSYMVPSMFITLNRVPFNPSGKLNRRILNRVVVDLEQESLARYSLADVTKRTPSTAMEILLQESWAKILRIGDRSTIGADDNFLRLGGDSIRAMQLVALIQSQDLELTVSNVFENPQLSRMAEILRPIEAHDTLEVKHFSLLGTGETFDENLVKEVSTQCQVEVGTIEDIYPATMLQEGLIALSNRQQGAYTSQMIFRLPTNLDIGRFKAAWEQVVDMISVLRTRLVLSKTAETLQVVLQEPLSWQTGPDLDQYLKQDLKKPVSYGSSLCRFAIVDNHFIWTAHHALYDGWSLHMIFDTAEKLYHRQEIETLVSFNRFIHYLQIQHPGAKSYWRSEFAGEIAATFPTLPHPGFVPHLDHTEVLSLETSGLSTSAITISSVLRGTWSILMKQYTDADDIVFGMPLSGRNASIPGINRIAGPTLATVPLRVHLDKSQSIAHFLQVIQKQAIDMIPFEQTGLQNIRHFIDNADAANFTNLLLIQPKIENSTQQGFLEMSAAPTERMQWGSYALVLECNLSDDEITIEAHHDSRIISIARMKRILAQFQLILRQLMTGSSQTCLREVETLTLEDEAQIMQWNKDTTRAVDSCVHDLFHQMALAQPRAPAICSFDGDFTYGEVDEISSRLAIQLAGLGVGPEVMVPLCFDKSAWTVIAMLGVLKANGSCVPINPNHPQSRLASIFDVVRPTIALVAAKYAQLLHGMVPSTLIVDESWSKQPPLDSNEAPDLQTLSQSRQSSFVVFTSGSTGVPKGIILEHTSVCTSIREHGKIMGFTKDSRVLQFAAYTFDASIADIFTTLAHGGCICVPSENDRLDTKALAKAINRMRVNLACLTPTVASLLDPRDVRSLRHLSLGGEAVTQTLVSTWSQHVNLVNIYGPAECTIWSMGQRVSKTTAADIIGHGLGTLAWIVDALDHNKLVPIGCVGELLLEGPLLARGYLKDEEKTRKAFISSPEWLRSETSTRRLYKTGDLVFYNEDGTMSYVGRKDTQVKLNGQRVELGEIEFHIKSNLSAAEQIAVEVVSRPGIDKHALALFVQPAGSAMADGDHSNGITIPISRDLAERITELRMTLADALPAYMIPSIFVALPSLPLNASRKLDRGLLRRIVSEMSDDEYSNCLLSNGEKKEMSTELEIRLQALWARVLNVATHSIGAGDSFLGLGGDSIAAMRLVEITRRHDIVLSVTDIFQNPQLSKMAIVAEKNHHEQELDVDLPPFSLITSNSTPESVLDEAIKQCQLTSTDIEDIYPCTPLQEGLFALSTKQQGAYIAQMAFSLPEWVEVERFCHAWQTLVNMHHILRTRIIYSESAGTLQVVSRTSITWKRGLNLEQYLQADLARSMHYGSPLARYAILGASPNNLTFVWTAHHAIYDGWSTSMLFNQLEELYNGRSIEDPTPFTRFIQYLNRSSEDEARSFWQLQLDNGKAQSFPQLPISSSVDPRPDQMQSSFLKFSLPKNYKFTPSTVLRSAWALVIAEHADSEDVVFGAPLSGRQASVPGILNMSGPTITTVPIRFRLDKTKPINVFLQEVQDQAAAMIPFEHTGLQNIRRLINDSANATKLNNLFIVQPSLESDSQLQLLKQSTGAKNQEQFDTYPLVVQCTLEDHDNMKVLIQFDQRFLPLETVERISQQFDSVVQQLLNTSNERVVADVHVFSKYDEKTLMEWNKSVPEATDECVHDLISSQARLTPDAPAVCAHDGSFTYQELDDMSTRLGSRLIYLGVGPETVVPFCFDKSAWTIIALLAIFKAGGACVALNPLHPTKRLSTIINSVRADLAITSPQYADLLTGLVSTILPVDLAYLNTLESGSSASLARIQPSNLAFVVFTSGSTGTPKGIAIEHRNLATSIRTHGPAMSYSPASRFLQYATYTFDSSFGEIFTTLAFGGCICVPSEYDRLNDITGAINRLDVNMACLTPTIAGLLDPKQVPSLEVLILGGEACTQALVRKWAERLVLVNGYGPAECTNFSTVHSNYSIHTPPSTIGRAIGCTAWIVDRSNSNKLCAIGCVGELVLEGPILSRGYIDAEQTAKSFINNLDWADQESREIPRRFYKTGDLVKYGPAGVLEYIGRKDTQIKLHGQRIELGEVEHCIAAQSGVQDCIAILPHHGHCKEHLVAVISLDSISDLSDARPASIIEAIHPEQQPEASAQVSRIHDHISLQLPEYMIPTMWFAVETLPLTTSAKLDRLKTTQWVENMDDSFYHRIISVHDRNETEPDRPFSEMERKIQVAWSSVLNVPASLIGLNTSFLKVGGDSITAMQVVSRCRAEGLFISVQDLLRTKTIAGIALLAKASDHHFIVDSEDEQDTSTSFDLSPIQHLYFNTTHSTGAHFYNQGTFLRLRKYVPEGIVASAIRDVVVRHPMLRARFNRKDDGAWKQSIQREVESSYGYQAYHVTYREEIPKISSVCQASMNIETGPVFATQLFQLDEGTQLIFLAAHHLVIDLVSWRIVVQDLEDALQGISSPIAPLSFRTWCKLQESQSKAYLTPTETLPHYIEPADYAYWGMAGRHNVHADEIKEHFALDHDVTELVFGSRCNETLGTEPVELVLAALLQAFKRTFPDRSSPTIFNEGHGREPWDSSIDVSQTVGWFTTLTPIHVPLINGDVVQTTRQVKDTRRKVPERGRAYFASRYLTPKGREAFSGHEEMEIIFNYTGQFQQLGRDDALLSIEDGADESQIPSSSPTTRRPALFEISLDTLSGATKLSLTYNKHTLHKSRILQWMSASTLAIGETAKALARMQPEQTLVDYSLASLSYEGLGKLTHDLQTSVPSEIAKVDDVFPCSPMQQGILLSQIKEPARYRVRALCKVLPPLNGNFVDPKKLAEAWQQVVNKHEALRTLFLDTSSYLGHFSQVLLKSHQASISHVQCNNKSVVQFLKQSSAPDYGNRWPPHHLTVCTTDLGEVYILIEVSHVVTDGASVILAIRDFALAYSDVLSPVKSTQILSKYIAHLQKQPLDKALAHWKGYLIGMLPSILPGSGQKSIEHRSVEIEIKESFSSLQKFCNDSGATLASILQATWSMVLRLYTGSDDVCFGYLTFGRDAPVPGIDEAVGLFINMLICRVKFNRSSDTPFSVLDLIQRVQNDFLDSFPYQYCSLAEIQHELGLSGQSLFNTCVSIQTESTEDATQSTNIGFELIEADDPAEYDVTLNVHVKEHDMKMNLTYWSPTISDPYAANIASTFSKAISSVIENAAAAVVDLNLLSNEDEKQVVEWNRTTPDPMPAAVDDCVHNLVHAQALLQPDAQAVCAWDSELTYRELDDLSTRLAGHLAASFGIGPEVIVPLCFDKSAWTIVTMLAVVKAGGACIGLSPAYPASRMESIIQDSNAKLVLVAPQHEALFNGLLQKAVVIEPSFLSSLPITAIDTLPQVVSTNPVFVLYTSGTTGRPKGIVVEHGAFCSSSQGFGTRWHIDSSTRVFQFAAYSYDVSVSDIFTTIMRGGCICVPSEHERVNNLSGAINRTRANWAFLTPTVASLLPSNSVPDLKTLVLGGEAPTKANIQQWSDKLDLIITYGPAECSIYCMGTPPTTLTSSPANLGYPIGSKLWICDRETHDRLAPIGSVGELLVEGPILARGYFNDKQKTEAAFIENPAWSKKHGTVGQRRFYKTGDLVRYNFQLDGTMSFAGRKDTQVKYHGQRVELAEIEHHLRTHFTKAKQIAVEMLAPTGSKDTQVLAAFLSLGDSEPVEKDSEDLCLALSDDLQASFLQLQEQVAQLLPPFMVPSLFVPLCRMPLNTSGKLDRRQLREVAAKLPDGQFSRYSLNTAVKRAPVNDIERKMQKIWANLLGFPENEIGADDNFFRVGGDSIQAMRLVAKAQSEGLSLTVGDIFQSPQLSMMCHAAKFSTDVEGISRELEPFSLVDLAESSFQLMSEAATQCGVEKDLVQDAYPTTPLQEGLFALSTQQQGAYVARLAFALPPTLDIPRFKKAWQAISNLHPILRTRIVYDAASSKSLQVVIKEDINWHSATNLEDYLETDKAVPVSYGSPLIRYAIIENSFVWTTHHAIYDGWSVELILKDVAKAYDGQEIQQRPSFNLFIDYIKQADMHPARDFWLSQFSEDSPIGFPHSPVSTYQPTPSRSLSSFVPISRPNASDITMPTFLRGAWALILARYSESNDVIYGAPLSGRNASVPGILEMAGPTITTVPIRTKIDGNQSIPDYLDMIQEQSTIMIPYEQTGIQNINRFVGQEQESLDIMNLLVIQPAVKFEDDNILNLKSIPTDLGEFGTYALSMVCNINDSGVELTARYDDNVINSVQIERMMRQFERVLLQLASESPAATLSSVELLCEADISQIMLWNKTLPETVDVCVHELIRSQAQIQPNATAISSWDGEMSYSELDDFSTKLAHYLISIHVCSGDVVALCFEKSMWVIISILAVLKTGAACVSVDPTHPKGRIYDILTDADARYVLTAPHLSSIFGDFACRIVGIESALLSSNQLSNDYTKLPDVPTRNAAFIIFTSGSTGKPKGIVLEHRSISTSVKALIGSVQRRRPTSRLLQFASYTFDVSISDIIVTLTNGACICIPSEEDRVNDLAGAIRKFKVDWVHLTPTVAGVLQPKDVPELQTLVVGGEAVTKELIQTWAESVNLIICYGNTECSITTAGRGPAKSTWSPEVVGKPIGCNFWICEPSDHNRLAPLGCTGELVIEGVTLARCYLKDPQKTNAAFITNPGWCKDSQSSRRFYKTGDLVRYEADGSIRFISRKDTQVKLHGLRIELGEVEHCTRLQPDVQSAIILLPKSGPCKQQLVAVVKLGDFPDPASSDTDIRLIDDENIVTAARVLSVMREKLFELLPDYMVPSVWLPVKSIPLTMSGKIARSNVERWVRELPEETYHGIAGIGSQPEPQRSFNPMEKTIRTIWSNVLAVPEPQIGLNKSFIRLGGDSITAMQVVARGRAHNIQLTVKDVLKSQTLGSLAQKATTITTSSVVTEETFETSFSLSPIQKFYFQRLAENETTAKGLEALHFYQNALLQLNRAIPREDLALGIKAVISRHSMLRARFSQDGTGAWSQLVRRELDDSYHFQVYDLEHQGQVSELAEELQAKIDITSGPVFVAALFIVSSANMQFLFLAAHHLVIDLVSWRIVAQDLETFLETKNLPQSPTSFQSWCKIQETSTQRPEAPDTLPQSEQNYWGMQGVSNLMGDTISEEFSIERTSTERLFSSSNDALRTEPIDIILGVILKSFSKVFRDRKPPAVFNEGHGRDTLDSKIDLSETVGWFTNLAPLEIPVSREENVTQTISRVKDTRFFASGDARSYLSSRLSKKDENSLELPVIELMVNYIGRYQQMERPDSLFRLVDFPNGAEVNSVGPAVPRSALFDISISVVEHVLHVKLAFNQHMQRQKEIWRWLHDSKDLLIHAIDILSEKEPDRTLSDFPLLPLTYEGLDYLKNVQLPRMHRANLDALEDAYPCSPMQQGILFSQLRDPGTYKIQVICEIFPPHGSILDLKHLGSSWQMVVDRHPSLRTVFTESMSKEGFFDQLVLRTHSAVVSRIKCNSSDPSAFLKSLPPLVYSAIQPPHRLTICESSDNRVYTMLEISHALTDGTSTLLLMRDIAMAYANQLPLGSGPLYSSYMAYLQKQPSRAALSYWEDYLTDLEPCYLPLLSDDHHSAEHHTVDVQIKDSALIHEYCSNHGFTMANVLQAVWALVLKCYSGSDDICFGYLASGRDVQVDGIEDAVGLFINMLVCRVKLANSRSTTVEDIIEKLQDDFLQNLPYQHCSLAEIQHSLDLAGQPLFNTCISLQRAVFENWSQPSNIDFQKIGGDDPAEVSPT